jgi:hypothetical protein
MTAPTERTLFEKINDLLPDYVGIITAERRAEIQSFCDGHDKRLADAEKQIDKYYVIVGQRDESINALTSLYEKCVDREIALSQQVESAHQGTRDQVEVAQGFSDEINNLRALIVDCNQVTSNCYGDFILYDCVDNNGDPYQSQYLADILAAPQQEQSE